MRRALRSRIDRCLRLPTCLGEVDISFSFKAVSEVLRRFVSTVIIRNSIARNAARNRFRNYD